ncbi:hypothetical protein E8E14_000155 [Neopestalotiopsis sp. 37M]|nr:hypothetical protein E8E14_000155 [Neopestalotiopsis sp. 37M]
MNVYLVTGSSNILAIFRSSFSSDPWILSVLEHSGGYAHKDLAKFAADQSGGAYAPRKSSIDVPEKRIWHAKHRLHDDTLVSRRSVSTLSAAFQRFFGEQLSTFPAGEWVDVQVMDFMKHSMSTAATCSLLGTRLLEINPGFIDAFWKFEKHVEPLAFGLPHWLNRSAVRARDEFRVMCLNWYKTADHEFDWDRVNMDGEDEWEPVFGSRVSRGLSQWIKSFDFGPKSISGIYALFVFGLQSNTIVICTWVMMEIIKDPDLLLDVRQEVQQASVRDSTGDSLSPEKLASLPLLQSLYTEALRVHVSILITRTSVEPVTIDGYNLPAGSIFQAPTHVTHFDEAIWGEQHHPASEFWAYRHIKEVETRNDAGESAKERVFSLSGRAGSFFPYGGGISICAGRNFAKQEVLLAVAMLVLKYDIEFIEWLKLDGTSSDRPPMDDDGEGGLGAAMAKVLHDQGYHVFATMRDTTKSGTLASLERVEVLELEITSRQSISSCVEHVRQRTGGTLDMLVNNAARSSVMPLLDVNIDDAKRMFDVNFWSILAVTQAFAPLLVQAQGVLVNHSSVASKVLVPWHGTGENKTARKLYLAWWICDGGQMVDLAAADLGVGSDDDQRYWFRGS